MVNQQSAAVLAPGAAVGPYRIAAEIAPGLFEAVDPRTQGRVALRPLSADAAAADRLRRAASVRHPNLLPVVAVESHGDASFLVSEFGGASLADHLTTRGRFPWREATRVAADAARGLVALHAAGLTHGDLNPASIQRDANGTVRVTDFALDQPPAPHYAAPERHAGMAGDARSDVYSLGATYFALLAGRPPFAGATTAAEIARAHNHEPVPAVRDGLPDLPLRCDTVIHKAMAKNPADRYPSASHLLTELAALATFDAAAPPLPPIPPFKPRRPSLSELARRFGPAILVVTGLAAASYGVFVHKPAGRTKAKDEKPQPLPSFANSIGMTLVRVPGGETVIGDMLRGDARVHRVLFAKSFWIGTREVTQREYQAVMGVNPSQFVGDSYPVESVAWAEAIAFCDKLSARDEEQKAGRRYRLPTEAEWEHCCRAGTPTPFAFGTRLLGASANTLAGGLGRTAAVGTYAPNAWGLYDMHGNVWEWCSDWYEVEAYTKNSIDPAGPSTGQVRVARGGSYNADPDQCRSGYRHDAFVPETKSPELGFRVVCVVENETMPPPAGEVKP